MKRRLVIGIDPGVNTGFAVYDPVDRSLALYTYKIHQAFVEVARLIQSFHLEIIIEDPNLWTHFQNTKDAKLKLQGAGSVKRDFSAWRDFLNDHSIPFIAVRPNKAKNVYAYQPELFTQITGYNKKCSEHARVAGMLVWGMK